MSFGVHLNVLSNFSDVSFLTCGDSDENSEVYQLDTSNLHKDKYHIFFPVDRRKELAISEYLENELSPLKNEKSEFNIKFINCSYIDLIWCSFPKKFKEICEIIANTFQMTIMTKKTNSIDKKVLLESIDRKITLKIPAEENILYFQDTRISHS